jgi:hypothetical protein
MPMSWTAFSSDPQGGFS